MTAEVSWSDAMVVVPRLPHSPLVSVSQVYSCPLHWPLLCMWLEVQGFCVLLRWEAFAHARMQQ